MFEVKIVQNVQAKVQQSFNFNKYPPLPPPSPEKECQQWVKNFPATVTISSIERKAIRKCRRKFTARSSEKIGAVRASVGLSLKQIIRRNSQELRISYVSLQRILNVDLHLHSMHIYICIYIYIYLYLYLQIDKQIDRYIYRQIDR